MKIINFDRRLSLINSPIINCAHCKINERTFLLQTIIESSVLCARIYFLILCKWRHVLLLTSFFYVTDAVLQNKTKTLFYTKKVRIGSTVFLFYGLIHSNISNTHRWWKFLQFGCQFSTRSCGAPPPIVSASGRRDASAVTWLILGQSERSFGNQFSGSQQWLL